MKKKGKTNEEKEEEEGLYIGWVTVLIKRLLASLLN